MRLSYSKLESYETCPRMFYYEYIKDGEPEDENFYAQYGTFVHSLIDKANKKMIPASKVLEEYSSEYNKKITAPIDPELEDAYFFAGYEYFSDFKGVIPGAEIIESETKHIILNGHLEFSGIIDMVVKLPSGEIAIVDHKSTASRYFRGKTGDSKFRQLYIYAEILKQKKGYYPNKLIFNCFREKKLITRDFDKSHHSEVIAWMNNMIRQIVSDMENFSNLENEWLAFPTYYWCKNICKHRSICTEVN